MDVLIRHKRRLVGGSSHAGRLLVSKRHVPRQKITILDDTTTRHGSSSSSSSLCGISNLALVQTNAANDGRHCRVIVIDPHGGAPIKGQGMLGQFERRRGRMQGIQVRIRAAFAIDLSTSDVQNDAGSHDMAQGRMVRHDDDGASGRKARRRTDNLLLLLLLLPERNTMRREVRRTRLWTICWRRRRRREDEIAMRLRQKRVGLLVKTCSCRIHVFFVDIGG